MKIHLSLILCGAVLAAITWASGQEENAPNRPLDLMGSHGRFIKSYYVETEKGKYYRIVSVLPGHKFILTDVIGHNAAFIKLATDYKEKRIKTVFTLATDRLHLQSGISFEPGDSVYVQTDTDALLTFSGYFVVM